MKKVQITSVETKGKAQVIILDASFIIGAIKAYNELEDICAFIRTVESLPVLPKEGVNALCDKVLPFLENLVTSLEEAE